MKTLGGTKSVKLKKSGVKIIGNGRNKIDSKDKIGNNEIGNNKAGDNKVTKKNLLINI